jgi:hypothetical protein
MLDRDLTVLSLVSSLAAVLAVLVMPKIRQARSKPGVITCVSLLILLFAGRFYATGAESASLSQGYRADAAINRGSIVSLKNDSTTVEEANSERLEGLLGVVIAGQEALINLSSQDSTVQVATSGLAETLVSTINGEIKIGDRITASPINGVGMKATTSARIVGVAQSELTDATSGAVSYEVKDRDGSTKTVFVGRAAVLLDISYYVAGTGDERTVIPKVIQDLSDAIAGKRVSTTRIIVSGVLMTLALVLVVVLVYGAVKSSIISIGRNPLSQPEVRRSLLQVVAISIGVLLAAIVSIYLIISR